MGPGMGVPQGHPGQGRGSSRGSRGSRGRGWGGATPSPGMGVPGQYGGAILFTPGECSRGAPPQARGHRVSQSSLGPGGQSGIVDPSTGNEVKIDAVKKEGGKEGTKEEGKEGQKAGAGVSPVPPQQPQQQQPPQVPPLVGFPQQQGVPQSQSSPHLMQPPRCSKQGQALRQPRVRPSPPPRGPCQLAPPVVYHRYTPAVHRRQDR